MVALWIFNHHFYHHHNRRHPLYHFLLWVCNTVLFFEEVAKKISSACPESLYVKRGKYIIALMKLSVNANDAHPKIVIYDTH